MQLLSLLKELSLHPKNAEELKGLILQLAVQGKLTARWRTENPNVETAAVLLEKIEVEKQQLIADKKIKKEKPSQPIKEDEIPYELPESWVWCRLNEACEYIQRGKSPKYTESPKIPVISQKCVQWSGFDISRAKFITEESLEKYGPERLLQQGDLLWNSTGNGTIGRVISYPGSEYDKIVADSHVTVVRACKQYIDTGYLWIFTASPLIQNLVAGRVSGSTNQTELGTSTVKSMEFSFPPLEEQKAIVEVVNTLFKEVEALEDLTKERISLKEDFATSALQRLTQADNTTQEWNFLQQHFPSFFTEKPNIKKLRETILQLAVQGKLTAQWRSANPSVENASELLKRIEAEKQQLIAEKKIKKEKPLPAIEDEDKPYELPDGWVWCTLTDLVNVGTGSTPATTNSSYYHEGTIPWYTSSATNDDFAKVQDKLITQKAIDETNCKVFPEGSLIIALYGQGKTRGQISELVVPGATNQAIAGMIFFKTSTGTKEYLKLFFKKMYHEIRLLAEGGAQPNLNVGKIKATIVPLPSIEETVVIIEKVNSLMALCDELEQQIDNSQTQIEQLMQSCLREVFEE